MAETRAAATSREASPTADSQPKDDGANSAPGLAASSSSSSSSAGASPAGKSTSKADEAHEAPVRRQLKETSIAEQQQEDSANDTDDSAVLRGRASRKRSYESITPAGPATDLKAAAAAKHVRKRSRGIAAQDEVEEAGHEENDVKRRSLENKREAAAKQDDGIPAAAETRAATPPPQLDAVKADVTVTSPQQGKRARGDEAEKENGDLGERVTKKRPQSPEKRPAAVPTGSGFANFSSDSPFAALGASKTATDKQTAPSAFAASGFASLAGSAASPFGSLNAAKPSEAKKDANGDPKPTGFAALGASSASPFASAGGSSFGGASPFGSILGSGFASTSAFAQPLGGGKLKSFASPDANNAATGALKPGRSFGSPAADDGDAEGSGGEDRDGKEDGVVGESEDKRDERFHEREIETGEEDEDTIFSARAKLFILDGVWKERGVGTFKFNVRKDDTSNGRFVMRADGSHRVVLNSAVKRGVMTQAPTDVSISFLGFKDDGSAQLYRLRMRTKDLTTQLFEKVAELLEDAA